MGFHHVAVAVKDLRATHAFYTTAMDFKLVKVVVNKTEHGGWAKHAFYDTGSGGLMAFWELHDDVIGDDWRPGLSIGLGLPNWVNHLAFDAIDLDGLERHLQRWRSHGITVVEIDHDFCRSIYADDPDGTLVEFCTTTRAFSSEELTQAEERLIGEVAEFDPEPKITFHHPLEPAVVASP